MKVLLVLPFLLVSLISGVARADQCELVSDDVATHALAAMRGKPNVIEYCEPCGDKAPGEPHAIEHLAKQRDTEGYYAVTLDKREVDLAYLYVQTAPSTYENVAALAGCPTSGVSPSLHVDDASDRGVLISASERPVTHVQLAEAPTPPPPAAVTYVIETHDHLGIWAVIAACALSSGLWALATVLLLRRRRAIAMRPRAIDMVDRG
ncbi:MAG: hypothetical protein ABI678_09850 [Kofleriaceae bacterium]